FLSLPHVVRPGERPARHSALFRAPVGGGVSRCPTWRAGQRDRTGGSLFSVARLVLPLFYLPGGRRGTGREIKSNLGSTRSHGRPLAPARAASRAKRIDIPAHLRTRCCPVRSGQWLPLARARSVILARRGGLGLSVEGGFDPTGQLLGLAL